MSPSWWMLSLMWWISIVRVSSRKTCLSVRVSMVAFLPDCASLSGFTVRGAAKACSKNGLLMACVMIVAPSATNAPSPPE